MGADVVEVGSGYSYRFGDVQLNCHGPGVEAEPVARVPVAPGNSDLFVWFGPVEGAVEHLRTARRDGACAPAAVGQRGVGRASASATRTAALAVEFISSAGRAASRRSGPRMSKAVELAGHAGRSPRGVACVRKRPCEAYTPASVPSFDPLVSYHIWTVPLVVSSSLP